MKISKEPAYVAATLAWCNERRTEQSKEPLHRLPKGKRNDGDSCPCGKATEMFVGDVCASFKEKMISTPAKVADFIHAFDEGRLPQYDENIQ